MASVKDMTRFGLDMSRARKISRDDFAILARQGCQPQKNDVLIAKDGATALDTVCIVKRQEEVVLLSSVAILRPDPSKILPNYLRYFLDCSATKSYMKAAFTTGAAIPRVVLKDFKKVQIKIPPMGVQHQISVLVGQFDDLIENNARRIAILEEMVRRIYEEWFVNYRFPGHESVPLVESELGLVPEGWDVVSAADAVEVNPKVKVPKDGEKPFVPMGCLSEVNMLISNIEARAGNSGAKFQNGDTLFARITPCLENGKTAYVQFLSSPASVAFGSTEFIVLRSRKLTPEFVYLLARSENFRNNAIKSMAGADGRQRVKEACFASYMLAHPDAATLEKFHGLVHPMFDMIHVLARKNENLRETRDLLLPRLISGELDVSTLPMPEDLAA
jgi:type I restriction enzyme S subunit